MKRQKTRWEIENGSIRTINAHFRSKDESHLWPVCGRFDVTERAIRRLRRAGCTSGGFEYFTQLEMEISIIVNSMV